MLCMVTQETAFGKRIATALTERGIFLFRCTPDNAAFFCEEKECGGVMLDARTQLSAMLKFCQELRRRYPPMPIALLAAPGAAVFGQPDCILRQTDFDAQLEALYEFGVRVCGFRTQVLSTPTLSVTSNPDECLYMGVRFPLSPREHTLLRCLFYRYPRVTSADDLMSLCYHDADCKIGNLAVQLHAVNQRAERLGLPPLVVNVYRKGYCLRDGILL